MGRYLSQEQKAAHVQHDKLHNWLLPISAMTSVEVSEARRERKKLQNCGFVKAVQIDL